MAWVTKRRWTYKGEIKTAWVVRYSDQEGVRRQQTFKHKKAADMYRTKVETEIEKGIHTPHSISITVREAAQQYLDHAEDRFRKDHLKRGTVYRYQYIIKKHILPHLGGLKLSALTAPIIQNWADTITSGPKPAHPDAALDAISSLRQIISLAQRRGQIVSNVVVEAAPEIDRPQRQKREIPSKDEIKTMLTRSTGYLKVILHLAVFTGMRQGELLGLLWDDIDFNTETIHVLRSADRWGKLGRPKTKSSVRDIPMAPTLVKMLKEWKLASPKHSLGLVFCATRNAGVILPANFYNNVWRLFMKDIGLFENDLPKYHFHALRHVAASLLIEQGEVPKVIQKIMGHASIKMTYDVYGHLFDESDAGRASLAAIDTALLG